MNVIRFFQLRRDPVGLGPPWIGTDVFVDDALVGGEGAGPDPRTMLEQLRAELPAAIQMRICGCGHSGCWSLATTARRERAEVVWDDWRDGVEDDEAGFPSTPVGRPRLHFRARQYAAAVDQLEREWQELNAK